MTATELPVRRKTTAARVSTRPITDVLRELAYLMHATKVVGQRETPSPSRTKRMG